MFLSLVKLNHSDNAKNPVNGTWVTAFSSPVRQTQPVRCMRMDAGALTTQGGYWRGWSLADGQRLIWISASAATTPCPAGLTNKGLMSMPEMCSPKSCANAASFRMVSTSASTSALG